MLVINYILVVYIIYVWLHVYSRTLLHFTTLFSLKPTVDLVGNIYSIE